MNLDVRHWIGKLAERGIALPPGVVRVGGFGDSEALSDELIGLVRDGVKCGTSSLAWSWAFEREIVPIAGDLEIVLDWREQPALILRVTEVTVVAFEAVTAAFAAAEGEGDRSLSSWRDEHWRFFSHECDRIGRSADRSMPVVCERFEVLQVLTSHAT